MMLERGKLNDGREISYACGLEHGKYRGLTTIGHSGGDAGFSSYLVRFPDQSFSVAVLSNHASAGTPGLAYRVADLYLAGDFTEGPTLNANRDTTPAQAVTISQSALSRWAGLYRNPITRDLWTLESAAGQLNARGPFGAFQLLPASETRFVSKPGTGPLAIEFSLGANQRPGGARVTLRAEDTDLLEPVDPAMADLDLTQFAGSYLSEELETTYRVRIENDQLLLARRRHPEQRLRVLCRDGFECDGLGSVEFTRDAKGKVDGALISEGRVLRLRFRKVS
jgi:hypothetical protein